ncbi:fused MFS/spermidine synthase [Chitinispirillales bacterium ANBcel5]|uniref:fused MFS/spermidine synthase n=1 Tax=Cellulosispirillum alkaliphilum TaxID=3039283 RepID=UPI002A516AA4|nr:fused MFS/spermidine synthase [Chitinispirillales bacterium ANBcel5]
MLIYLYFALFFVSGISGLIYESIWSQYLKLFLGHAAYSQTLVLVIYMGGMALGSWIASMKMVRIKNLLAAFALIEVSLGIMALLFHNVFITYLSVSFDHIIPSLNSSFLISVYKWITASLIILPQSILLGATFPFMAAGIVRRFPGLSGYKISVIYFVNTLGASLGVLWSGFFLVERYGLRGAIVTGGILDIFVGLMVFYLCRKSVKSTEMVEKPEKGINEDVPFEIPSLNAKKGYYIPLLLISSLTATASFIYEIGWIRMLSLVLGSSTHAFELMLSAFILGIALGSFFVRNRIDRIKNVPRFLGIVQIIMGSSALMTIFVYGNMFEFMQFTMNALERNEQGYLLYNIISHFICMAIMLPSTICAGMVIPLITHILYKKGFGEQAIGKVYSLNTFGGIVGIVLAVWILMPLFGLKLMISIGGTLDIAIGLLILYTFAETRFSNLKTAVSPVCVVIVFVTLAFGHIDPVLMASGVFRYGSISRNKDILSHRDGRTASVSLFRTASNYVLSTNGKPDASIGIESHSSDEYTMAMLGVIPMTVVENAKNAAVIGLGAGMTSHFLLYDQQYEQVDVIEIEPEMVRAARRMGERVANTFTDERCEIHIEDAKSFFAARNKKYDIIISEPSNPWVSGVSGLFSREFFKHIKNYINEDGILVQWFHKYECDISIITSILKAMNESFPNYDLYATGSDYIIVASPDPEADISVKRDVFEIDGLAQSLQSMGFKSIDDIRLIRFAGHKVMDPLIQSYPYMANSDFHPFVDLYAVKHRYMGSHVEELDHIRNAIVPVRKYIEWDTSYIDFELYRNFPDVNNLREIYNAKDLYSSLVYGSDFIVTTVNDYTSDIQMLDLAYSNPEVTTFTQIQNSVVSILEKTLPYLSVSEMRALWDVIEEKISKLKLTPQEQTWVDLLQALCYYDMEALNEAARILIPTGTIADTYSSRILLASLFISSHLIQDYHGVEEAWSRFQNRNNANVVVRLAREVALLGMEENQ